MKPHSSMLMIAIYVTAVFSCCQNAGIEEQTADMPVINGHYLSMKPPGEDPELFAPGIVSSIYNEHSGAVFTPDGKELFWTTVINEGRTPRMVVVLHMKQENGVWTPPEIAPFNKGSYTHINSISPDGKRLYFFSEESDGQANAWVVDKTESGWSDAHTLRVNTVDNPGSVINEVHEARSGNLYMSGPLPSMPGGRGIVKSTKINGVYKPFESLGVNVNSPHSDRFPNHSPTIDPDEKFIIFASTRPGGHSDQDLYISYRKPDDTWGQAINLGPRINAFGARSSWPQLSPDGRYMFFVSMVKSYRDIHKKQYSYKDMEEIQKSVMNGWGNIYWVNTSFVEELKPKGLRW